MKNMVSFELAKLALKSGLNDGDCENGYLLHDGSESFDFRVDWINALAIGAPTYDELVAFLESKGTFIAVVPELYVDGINWNWQVQWYLPKEEWEVTEIEGQKHPTHIADGTGWYGDNGEYPTRVKALEAAIKMGLMKLDLLYRNNSCDKLAKAYGCSKNELLTKIRQFSDELGDWSFRDFTMEQLEIIASKLGNPFEKTESK